MRLIYAAALGCVFQLATASATAQDTDQEPRLTHTSPEMERRDRAVAQEDIDILIRAEEILALPETKFDDVKQVLKVARERVSVRLANGEN